MQKQGRDQMHPSEREIERHALQETVERDEAITQHLASCAFCAEVHEAFLSIYGNTPKFIPDPAVENWLKRHAYPAAGARLFHLHFQPAVETHDLTDLPNAIALAAHDTVEKPQYTIQRTFTTDNGIAILQIVSNNMTGDAIIQLSVADTHVPPPAIIRFGDMTEYQATDSKGRIRIPSDGVNTVLRQDPVALLAHAEWTVSEEEHTALARTGSLVRHIMHSRSLRLARSGDVVRVTVSDTQDSDAPGVTAILVRNGDQRRIIEYSQAEGVLPASECMVGTVITLH